MEETKPMTSQETRLREIITKLREDAHEAESPYYTKTPVEPDWDYIAKAFKEVADELDAALAAAPLIACPHCEAPTEAECVCPAAPSGEAPGDYSCATCGMGMVEPCEHWKAAEAMTPSVDGEPLEAFRDDLATAQKIGKSLAAEAREAPQYDEREEAAMSDLLTPTDESVLQMSAATLRSLDRETLASELDRVAAKLENALIEARERGYDDAKSADLPASADLEADFRRWKGLNPHADLRSAWIAGVINERKSVAIKRSGIEAAQQVVDAVQGRLTEIQDEINSGLKMVAASQEFGAASIGKGQSEEK
jgi:hypothetical protein